MGSRVKSRLSSGAQIAGGLGVLAAGVMLGSAMRDPVAERVGGFPGGASVLLPLLAVCGAAVAALAAWLAVRYVYRDRLGVGTGAPRVLLWSAASAAALPAAAVAWLLSTTVPPRTQPIDCPESPESFCRLQELGWAGADLPRLLYFIAVLAVPVGVAAGLVHHYGSRKKGGGEGADALVDPDGPAEGQPTAR